MNFEKQPPKIDEYSADFREQIGIKPDQKLILQPTRIVKRKGIENAIELVSNLDIPAKFVITHDAGDEGYAYQKRIETYAKAMGVDIAFINDIISSTRSKTKDGRKTYTISDVYPHADLITYPSTFEGFGNAFLETIYFKKPIVVNNYSIYFTDIKPHGFRVIEFDDFITPDVVKKVEDILKNPKEYEDMVEHNFEVGKRCFSYNLLELKLKNIIFGCIEG